MVFSLKEPSKSAFLKVKPMNDVARESFHELVSYCTARPQSTLDLSRTIVVTGNDGDVWDGYFGLDLETLKTKQPLGATSEIVRIDVKTKQDPPEEPPFWTFGAFCHREEWKKLAERPGSTIVPVAPPLGTGNDVERPLDANPDGINGSSQLPTGPAMVDLIFNRDIGLPALRLFGSCSDPDDDTRNIRVNGTLLSERGPWAARILNQPMTRLNIGKHAYSITYFDYARSWSFNEAFSKFVSNHRSYFSRDIWRNLDLFPVPIPHNGLPMIVGDYRCSKVLGEGGFGTVYAATDPAGVPCVLKLIPKNGEWEVAALEALTSMDPDAIVYMLKTFEWGPRTVLVTGPICYRMLSEVYSGESLTNVRFLKQVLKTLKDVHARGWAHHDVKPSNIGIIDRVSGDKAVLLDLGCAERIPESGFFKPSSCGTTSHFAPERETCEFDATDDIWALGVTFYEVFYGTYPWATSKENPWHADNCHLRPEFHRAEKKVVQFLECGGKESVKDLLLQMLWHPYSETNPYRKQWQRITAEEALKHPAFKMLAFARAPGMYHNDHNTGNASAFMQSS